MKESGKNLFLGSAIIAAVASSLCCILPFLAVVLGVGAFGIASVFETLRPYLLVVVVLALAFSFYQTYVRREKCAEGQACATKPIGRLNQLILWATTIGIAVFAFFPFYSSYIVSVLDKPQPTMEVNQVARTENVVNPKKTENAVTESESQTRKTLIIEVEGMTCEGCASHIDETLKKLKGVISAKASYKDKNVKVVYNPNQITLEKIKKAINEIGYIAK